jgi:methyltransferase
MTGMAAPYIVVAFLIIQRLAELVWAARNTRRLLAQGAVEHGARHYPLFMLLHGAWLVALVLAIPAAAGIDVVWLGLFIVLQAARLWVILSLGPFWTTRVISLAGQPVVRRGPYRFLRHPNYAVVALEIVAVPMMFGAWRLALVFGLLNLVLLAWRIRIEEAALAPRRAI